MISEKLPLIVALNFHNKRTHMIKRKTTDAHIITIVLHIFLLPPETEMQYNSKAVKKVDLIK